LGAQVVGRADDNDPPDHATGEQTLRQLEREGRLAGARGRRDEEVAGAGGLVLLERGSLPGA